MFEMRGDKARQNLQIWVVGVCVCVCVNWRWIDFSLREAPTV